MRVSNMLGNRRVGVQIANHGWVWIRKCLNVDYLRSIRVRVGAIFRSPQNESGQSARYRPWPGRIALISSRDLYRGSAYAFRALHELSIVLFTPSCIMSHPHTSHASSPNFQLIFNNALKAYEKRTRSDLLAHPLAAQLQDCDTPSEILAVIHQQVEGLHHFQSADERLTRSLNPTVNVLFAFSGALGEGVGLVSLWP